MFEVLLAYFERNFIVTAENITLIKSVFLSKTIVKGEFLLREGEVPKYGAFVCKGFLRSYFIDNKGKEHIIQFAPENWWISAKPDGSQQAPSSVFIDAIEDSEVLLIDRAGHITMMEKIPGYAALFVLATFRRVLDETPNQLLGTAIAGLAFALYLTYIEAYELMTWCILCLISLVLISLISILAIAVKVRNARA